MNRKKSSMALGLVLCLFSVFMVSCGDERSSFTSAQPAAHGIGVPGDASWSLVYRATCEGGASEKCRGFYGFQLRSDGYYQVGPGPDHQSISGRIEPRELQMFQEFLGKLHTADFEINARGPERCVQAAAGPVDSIQISYHGSPHGAVRVAGSDVCFDSDFVSSLQDAKDLETWLASMAEKYYPVSFPNPCVSAASVLEAGFDDLRHCEQASDCAYVDQNFLPADRAGTPILVDDCSVIQTLPVANAFAAISSQRELLLQRDLAKRFCGAQLVKSSCSHTFGFDSGSAAPVCVEGVCQVNPRVQIR